MSKRAQTKHGRLGGYTLIEVMAAITVLAFVVLGLTQAIVAGQSQTYAALHEARAVQLAEAMLEEVLARPYLDPDGDTAFGPEGDESDRTAFDAIDDFHGFSETASTLADAVGAALPTSHQGYTRRVTVVSGTLDVSGLGSAANGVTVTAAVSDTTGRVWTLERWVGEVTP